MPPEIRPRNLDGEVQDFSLMPWQQVLELLRDGTPFKFNCGPVLIDFLLRHGLLDPDRETRLLGPRTDPPAAGELMRCPPAAATAGPAS